MMRKSRIFIILGLLCFTAALFLVGYNIIEDQTAGERSAEVLEQLTASIQQPAALDYLESTAIPEAVAEEIEYPDYILNPNMEMPTTEIDGNRYVGIISIPVLELELPVMDEWSYQKLVTAPCRFSGSIYQHNMVICGHNFQSHFGKLNSLTEGDDVTFTDMDGNVFCYEVFQKEEIHYTHTEDMLEGEGDLILFTCTFTNRYNRSILRCRLISQNNAA